MVLPNTRYRAQRQWSAFVRQKMNQTTTIGDPGAATVKVPFVSDATHPAMVVSDTMIVSGGGLANITLAAGGSGSLDAGARLTLRLNGVELGFLNTASNDNARSVTFSGVTLANGDQLEVWARREYAAWPVGNVRQASVDVVPAT